LVNAIADEGYKIIVNEQKIGDEGWENKKYENGNVLSDELAIIAYVKSLEQEERRGEG
jgi:hypothetical protein